MEATPEDYLVNQQIKDFVFDLHDASRRSHIADDLKRLYNLEFKDLSDKYCDKAPWPSAPAVSSQCIGNDGQPDAYFLCVYKELVYRHMFAKLKTNLDDKLNAWNNYCELFEFVLASEDASLELTAQWVFDVLHEFVYQFQSFCQFRCQNAGRNSEERMKLEAAGDAWAAPTVLRYLARLRGCAPTGGMAAKAQARSPLHFYYATFASVCLSRAECLLGDYEASVQALDGIDVFDEASEVSRIFGCRLNMLYHLGYALMMLRRYRDALRTFDPVLAQLARAAKHGGFKAFPDENQVQKSYDRMLALYACCLALAPGHVVDDGVMYGIRDKYGDKYRMLERNDQPTFEAMLAYASPKHIVPSIPDYNQPLNASKDAFHQQLRLFNGEVAFHARVAELRSYLKLYSSIGIEKLAGFHDEDVAAFRARLVGAKAKMRQADYKKVGAELSTPRTAPDLHFYVDGDLIRVDEPPKNASHDTFFTHEMLKYDTFVAKALTLKPKPPADPRAAASKSEDRD
jgi:translation initiation factor 3 subunit L